MQATFCSRGLMKLTGATGWWSLLRKDSSCFSTFCESSDTRVLESSWLSVFKYARGGANARFCKVWAIFCVWCDVSVWCVSFYFVCFKRFGNFTGLTADLTSFWNTSKAFTCPQVDHGRYNLVIPYMQLDAEATFFAAKLKYPAAGISCVTTTRQLQGIETLSFCKFRPL